ncbi:MAG: Uma2 family endonuclease [Symploca sp. SIO3C6]|nr:Uma2 family endonuclease [Symploca sp. SIO3C6]NET04667.1 Uma2 family endonuclease [Symploca sp. SIO2B6]NET47200.1 Uma2 family endonuclease [Merismopedia sp. SIO2A8]
MTATTAKWTLEQYHQMIEVGILDDCHVELLNGEIVEMSPEGTPHAALSTRTANYLRQLLGEKVLIREGKPITLLTSNSEPEPDLAVLEPLEDEYFDHHPYPENIYWLIEYSYSSLEKDLDDKSKTYASAGIREYWVANLRDQELVVFKKPVNGEYRSQQQLRQGKIQPTAFPKISLSIPYLLVK